MMMMITIIMIMLLVRGHDHSKVVAAAEKATLTQFVHGRQTECEYG